MTLLPPEARSLFEFAHELPERDDASEVRSLKFANAELARGMIQLEQRARRARALLRELGVHLDHENVTRCACCNAQLEAAPTVREALDRHACKEAERLDVRRLAVASMGGAPTVKVTVRKEPA